MSTYETPIPGVAQYGQAALAAKTAYQNALTRLNQQRQGRLRQAGFNGDVDPNTGVIKNVRTDPYNPYGQFQQLRRGHAQGLDATAWNAQERGLGTGGGLAAQMQNDLRYQYGAEDAQFGQGLAGDLGAFQDQQNQAAYQRDQALYEAELTAARMALQNGDFNPADYEGLDIPAYGDTGPDPNTLAGAVARVVQKPKGYNPRAYVPGGSSAKVAKAIQAKGYAKPSKPAPAPAPVKRILPPAQAKMAAAAKKKGR